MSTLKSDLGVWTPPHDMFLNGMGEEFSPRDDERYQLCDEAADPLRLLIALEEALDAGDDDAFYMFHIVIPLTPPLQTFSIAVFPEAYAEGEMDDTDTDAAGYQGFVCQCSRRCGPYRPTFYGKRPTKQPIRCTGC